MSDKVVRLADRRREARPPEGEPVRTTHKIVVDERDRHKRPALLVRVGGGRWRGAFFLRGEFITRELTDEQLRGQMEHLRVLGSWETPE